MNPDLYSACRSETAYYQFSETVLKISGSDAGQFLQGQTTADVLELNDFEGHFNSILNPKAQVQALLFLYKIPDGFLCVSFGRDVQWVKEHLDKFIIMEDVELSDTSLKMIEFSGPGVPEKLKDLDVNYNSIDELSGCEFNNGYLCKVSTMGESGVLYFGEDFSPDSTELDASTYSILRKEAGSYCWGDEINDKNLLPETGLQSRIVSYDKGCFVGQEIVARVKYRGQVNKALMGLVVTEGEYSSGALNVGEAKAGKLVSGFYSPFIKSDVCFAYVNNKFRQPGDEHVFTCEDGKEFKAKVVYLPFYTAKANEEEADRLFHQAVDLFSKEDEEDDIAAADLLRQAIRKNPRFADAYEALGVLLSRHEQYDEAIELMKQLKEIDPLQVMAYSNLSLYYMKKGMIQEAEDEKTQATVVTFKKAAADRKKRKVEEQLQAEKIQEINNKMNMFRQVLEIDEEDPLANFGMGKAYNDLQRYRDAEPYLKKAIEVKKDYTVAWQQLADSYLKQKKNDLAEQTLKSGIEVAISNGDLMPKSDMEMKLADLQGQKSDPAKSEE